MSQLNNYDENFLKSSSSSSSNLNVINLGIARTDPVLYSEMYASTMVNASQLPEFVIEASNQHGYELAADCINPYYLELEGDIHALALIDLDKEGLSEYKPFLENYLNSCSQLDRNRYYEIQNTNNDYCDYLNENDDDYILWSNQIIENDEIMIYQEEEEEISQSKSILNTVRKKKNNKSQISKKRLRKHLNNKTNNIKDNKIYKLKTFPVKKQEKITQQLPVKVSIALDLIDLGKSLLLDELSQDRIKHALALFNLERQGLSQYKPFLDNYLTNCSQIDKDMFYGLDINKSKINNNNNNNNKNNINNKRNSIVSKKNHHDLVRTMPRTVEIKYDKLDHLLICKSISDKLLNDKSYLISLFNSGNISNLIASKCRNYFFKFLKRQLVDYNSLIIDKPLNDPNNSLFIQHELFNEYKLFMKNYLFELANNSNRFNSSNECQLQLEPEQQQQQQQQICDYSDFKPITINYLGTYHRIKWEMNITQKPLVKLSFRNERNYLNRLKYFNDYKQFLANIFYLKTLPKTIVVLIQPIKLKNKSIITKSISI
jgi:hypothetical protein